MEVEWDVNDTHVLAPKVKISLSIDGGMTFDEVLAQETDNDGEETITLPEVVTDEARIKVEAVDNYFFDISDADFSISRLTVAPDAAGGPVQRPAR